MSLEVRARIGLEVVGQLEIVNVTPCEHMHRSSCDCECRYKVTIDGRRLSRNVKHRRSDPPWSLVKKALEVAVR